MCLQTIHFDWDDRVPSARRFRTTTEPFGRLRIDRRASVGVTDLGDEVAARVPPVKRQRSGRLTMHVITTGRDRRQWS